MPHSQRATSQGKPVHIVDAAHPALRTPNAVDADWLRQWCLLDPSWSPRSAQPPSRTLPQPSPASFGLTLNTSSNSTTQAAANDEARRNMHIVLAHSLGLSDYTLVESLPSEAGGMALVCGLGLAGRAGREPVADMLLENLHAFILNATARRPAAGPVFAAGDTIEWGNYSTERGVASSNAEGLLIQGCPYDAACKAGEQGVRACGRFLYGPFNWTSMGHNVDLAPASKTGHAQLYFRTQAGTKAPRRIVTTFEVAWSSPPRLTLQLLGGEGRSVVHTVACQPVNSSASVTCDLPALAYVGLGLHMVGDKANAIKTTRFL